MNRRSILRALAAEVMLALLRSAKVCRLEPAGCRYGGTNGVTDPQRTPSAFGTSPIQPPKNGGRQA